jgi:hypothetical protein
VLLEHLIGTSRIVAAWGQPRATVDAALFHSVYGTDVYRHRSISPARRDDVRARIGEDAERLVWLFSEIDRGDFRARLQGDGRGAPLVVRHANGTGLVTVAPGDAFALLVIYMANEFEQTQADDGAPDRLFSTLAAMSGFLDPAFGTIPAALTPELRAMRRNSTTSSSPATESHAPRLRATRLPLVTHSRRSHTAFHSSPSRRFWPRAPRFMPADSPTPRPGWSAQIAFSIGSARRGISAFRCARGCT